MMRMVNSLLLAIMLLLGGTAGPLHAAQGKAKKMITIGVSQIVEHPALDADRQGFIDSLKDHGYVEGKNVTYDIKIAQGNMATANSIAQTLVGEKVDLILSIATPTSQACANATKTIPIVFSAVTDPVSAGLVKSLEHPGGNITGTHDRSPVARQLDLIRQVVPHFKRLGVIYNAGEDNSRASVRQIKEVAAKQHVQVVEATAANSSAVYMAAQSLVGRVDAVQIPTDNTVVSAFESVVKVCEDNHIPLFAADVDSVPRGAIAALAMDYYRLGRQTGDMAYRILQGAKPGDMPVETLHNLKLEVNKEAAKKMGVTLPPELLAKADKVY